MRKVFHRRGVQAGRCQRIGADHEQRAQFAIAGCGHDLAEGFARRLGQSRIFGKGPGLCDGHIVLRRR